MNPTTEQQPLQPPLQPLQPHRSSFSCDRHPTEQFNGFCTSCLCERLTTLDPSSASSSRRPSNAVAPSSSTSAALKAIFRAPNNSNKNKPSCSSSSFLPELRRTKSFSVSKNEGFSAGVFEPQRKSCDVRARSTLCSLINGDHPIEGESCRNLGSAAGCVTGPVLEMKEEGDEHEHGDNVDDEIRVSEEQIVPSVIEGTVGEIAEEELRTMKDHIDLDLQAKKPSGKDLKEIAGNFWSVASVFSKKWNNWRRKQKVKKRNGGDSAALPMEKPISRQYRETQSEIADYGFGRRSCDTDPRFSIDIGRVSVDNPRYSLDEPRASWDGYLMGAGGRNVPRLPPILSVVERSPAVQITRSDTQIPVQEIVPGDSAQTQQYYLDSSSRRRKSLDRSISIKKNTASMVVDIDEMKMGSNSKVTPETVDFFHRDSNSNSDLLRDDCSETFELGFRDNVPGIGNGDQKGSKKSGTWRKRWSLWGFIRRPNGNKKHDEDYRHGRGNGEVRGGFNRNMFRSNSSVSWRNSFNIGGSFGSVRNPSFEANGNGNAKKKRDDFVLERNRSVDNGMLRFYLTPSRSNSRRGGLGNSRLDKSRSFARRVLQ